MSHDLSKNAASQSVSQIRNPKSVIRNSVDVDYDELIEPLHFSFALDRRSFVQVLGAGVLITAIGRPVLAQRRGGGGGGFFGGPPAPLAARIHFADDGMITVFSGKVDAGQGARVAIAQAAAEELRVPFERVTMVLGDTALCPNDGVTAGSQTTPRTIPAVRQAAAAIRKLLTEHAAEKWSVDAAAIEVAEGKLKAAGKEATYFELAKDEALTKRLGEPAGDDAKLTPTTEWRTLGVAHPATTARDKITGKHEYPSDTKRPDMMYGCVLRPTKYGAKLTDVDLAPLKSMKEVITVRDGEFMGAVAPTAFAAKQAIEAVAKKAKWGDVEMPNSDELAEYLRKNAEGGVPKNPFAADVAKAAKSLRATYTIPYVQHTPLEPRTALAEWADGKLTVWTSTQNPFGVRKELVDAFRLKDDDVRVMVPDFGSGYGGKHTGEVAVEAARLAQTAKKPVMLRWSREEEFAFAYFRPAAVIDLEASLDDKGKIANWWHVNINAGGNSIESPYDIANKKSQAVGSKPPLRHGAYRALASTGNTFGRESFMDELAAAANADPLGFRLAQLTDPRLRPVLEEAAKRFDWATRSKKKEENHGVGLACSLDKGGFVACCCEVEVDRERGQIRVKHVTEVFDCGPVLNPENLRNQMQGAITMGLGPALFEEVQFKDGEITNGNLREYRVPKFRDVPTIDVHALNRTDVDPAGAGETPIIAIAPAIGNAVFHATGIRLRNLPLKFSSAKA
ncbi:MAG: molybdopterin cofactor-binding domain-containing protein [Pirellulales bacterium]